LISADDLPEYQGVLNRTANQPPEAIRPDDRRKLLSLPFRVVTARHRLGVISDALKAKIVEARRFIATQLPPALQGAIEFFDRESYNSASSLLDNILFGKIAYGQAQANAKVNRMVAEVLGELGFRDDVMLSGLDFHVGVAGARLSVAQRQKLALARAIVKRPDFIILHESLNALDSSAQQKVLENVRQEFAGRGLIWALHRPGFAKFFDQIWVMRSGQIIERGTFAELDRPESAFTELLAGG
jgi:ABC-type multidrug transport system fused ATPase/permease subunit